MPTCEPVQCDQEDVSGELRSVHSYGKRRRRRRNAPVGEPREDLLLVQSIQITDKFGFNRNNNPNGKPNDNSTLTSDSAVFVRHHHQDGDSSFDSFCVNAYGVVISCLIFLAVQIAIIAAWTYVWQRNKNATKETQQYINDAMSVTLNVPSSTMSNNVNRTESMCKLYDSSYNRRY